MEGGLGQFPLEQWFYEMPVCTRAWTTATVLTSVLVQCKVLTPFQLFYSVRAVFLKNQVWSRLLLFLAALLTSQTVLAPPHDVLLLRTSQPRPTVTRLLPTTLLTPPRRVSWQITGTVLMAACICDCASPRHVFSHAHTIPRTRSFERPGVYLESS